MILEQSSENVPLSHALILSKYLMDNKCFKKIIEVDYRR